MPKTSTTPKVPHLLFERGRYYYQRKVPLDVQDAVGFKKWREPVGADLGSAIDRVRELTKQHTELLGRLKDSEARQDFKTEQRRHRERVHAEKSAAADTAYREFLASTGQHDHNYFFEGPEAQALIDEEQSRPWVSAAHAVNGLEISRKVAPNTSGFLVIIARLEAMSTPLPRLTVPPFAEYKSITEGTSEKVREAVRFLPRIPDPLTTSFMTVW